MEKLNVDQSAKRTQKLGGFEALLIILRFITPTGADIRRLVWKSSIGCSTVVVFLSSYQLFRNAVLNVLSKLPFFDIRTHFLLQYSITYLGSEINTKETVFSPVLPHIVMGV